MADTNAAGAPSTEGAQERARKAAEAAEIKERSMRFLRSKGLITPEHEATLAQGRIPQQFDTRNSRSPTAAATMQQQASPFQAPQAQQQQEMVAADEARKSDSAHDALRAKIRERQTRLRLAPDAAQQQRATQEQQQVPQISLPGMGVMPPFAVGGMTAGEEASVDKTSPGYLRDLALLKKELFLHELDAEIKEANRNQLGLHDVPCYPVKSPDGVEDIKLSLTDEALAGIHPEQVVALRRLDVDGNNELTLSEVLGGAQEKKDLNKMAWFFGVAIFVVLLSAFFLFWVAFGITNPIDVTNHSLTAKGAGGKILRTAEAEQEVGVALLPLFNRFQLADVKELTVSNFFTVNANETAGATHTRCTTCPNALTVVVASAYKHSDTFAALYSSAPGQILPIKVVVSKGNIQVHRVPGQDPKTVFSVCALATCSQVKVRGINQEALKAKARKLGYVNTGRRVISMAFLARWRQRIRKQQAAAYADTRRKGLDHVDDGDTESSNQLFGFTCTTSKKKSGKTDHKVKSSFCRIKTKECPG